MGKNKELGSLEKGILLLRREAKNKSISIEKILHLLSGKGRALIVIFLALPFCQPIQIPGFSIPFGIVIAFFGIRMAFGKHVWLPKMVLSKKITPASLQKITKKSLLLVKKMKRVVHPRLNGICRGPYMQMINGLAIFILGIFLALPLPIPLTNLASAWSIFLIALGVLEDDGLLVLAGYLISLLTLSFFVVTTLSIMHILGAR